MSAEQQLGRVVGGDEQRVIVGGTWKSASSVPTRSLGDKPSSDSYRRSYQHAPDGGVVGVA
jgi:hypothetical protein